MVSKVLQEIVVSLDKDSTFVVKENDIEFVRKKHKKSDELIGNNSDICVQ